MSRTVHRVALTGGIATGKSYIGSKLREAGVPVVDADRLARNAVRPGTEALQQVLSRFGASAVTAEGEMDRRHVAEIVFQDEAARHDLEAIIHPLVRQGIEAFFNVLPTHTAFAVADIPLLFETGRAEQFEAVVVAACAPDIQITRVMTRDGGTREQAEQRLRAQWPIDDKVAKADYVIRTDGTFDQTDEAVRSVVASLKERWT